MTREQLQQARKALGLTQTEAARKLGVSQTYFSLFEKGVRPLTGTMTKKAVRLFSLPPTMLPIEKNLKKISPATDETLVKDLAALGYPGYRHLVSSRPKNPVVVLIAALSAGNLEGRLIEALPWVLYNFLDLEWETLIDAAKLRDLQNRLGFLTAVTGKFAEKSGDVKKAELFKSRELALEPSRLVKEDTLCRDAMTGAEKRRLREHRSVEAAHWNILSNLSAEHLNYAE